MPVGPIGGSHYVYDLDGHLIAEADALTGATIREYLWLKERPVSIVDNVSTTPVLYFVHSDHLARPVLVTDAMKAPVWSAVWKPFGEAQSIAGPLSLDARFPGQWYQIETGLAYNWHRHYDAATGRYTQPDPLGFVDGPGVYAYALSNPISLFDPSGAQARGRGGRSGAFEPSPMQTFWSLQYTYVRNQIHRYEPNYSEVSSRDFRPGPSDVRRLEEYLRQLEMGPQPLGGVYGLYRTNVCYYIGETNSFLRREREWKFERPGYDFVPLFGTNSPLQSRAMEQRYKDAFSPALNIRNPIGPRNPNIREYLNSIGGFRMK